MCAVISEPHCGVEPRSPRYKRGSHAGGQGVPDITGLAPDGSLYEGHSLARYQVRVTDLRTRGDAEFELPAISAQLVA